MEKVKAPLPKDHSAIIFDFGEERTLRKQKKAALGEYKPDFSNFKKYLETSKDKDKTS